MKKKIVWLILSCLMVVALLLASCAPAVVEEEEEVIPEEEEEVIPEEEEEVIPEEEMVQDSLGRLVEKPRYGGVLRLASTASPLCFDEISMRSLGQASTIRLTNENLYEGDWTKGLTGTGEVGWSTTGTLPLDTLTPWLAESWEHPDPDTSIYHIRKGVHFHNEPPANGREMDAYDVAFSFNRAWDNPRSYFNAGCPKDANIESITAPDKWTVVFKSKPGRIGWSWDYIHNALRIVPREVGEQNIDFNQWENSCGTGPFILKDYVAGSSTTFVRNPNYWRKHPLHPEDTMPYLDGVSILVVPDLSTRMAAMRTGKTDMQTGVGWEDAEQLRRTSPQLKERFWWSEVPVSINWRVDKPELPWHDIRVRRALWLGIDNKEIVDEYYRGNAELFGWPVLPSADFKDMYTPLEELPESIRELYEYKPEKAKQLLAEAGYPDGFKAEVICQSTTEHVDLLSIAKDSWSKIGVDLELKVVELGAYWGITGRKTHTQMIVGFAHNGCPTKPYCVTPRHMYNWSCIDDPKLNELHDAIADAVNFFDYPKRCELVKEMVPLELEPAYMFVFPAKYTYSFWWPWVKGYSGEKNWGYQNGYGIAFFSWLDQDLKKEMGY